MGLRSLQPFNTPKTIAAIYQTGLQNKVCVYITQGRIKYTEFDISRTKTVFGKCLLLCP